MLARAKATSRESPPGWMRSLCLCGLAGMLAAAGGCQSDGNFLSRLRWENVKKVFYKEPPLPPPAADHLVMRGGGLENDQQPVPGSVQADLEGAKNLYAQQKYKDAEKIFHRLAKNTKNPVQLAEEALFFEGDCLYLQGRYPKAESTFKKLLTEFRWNCRFREQAARRLFDIANYWLDDTRQIMKSYEEKRAGKRFFVFPLAYVHFDKEKPFLDEEGRAMEALEEVHLADINGPLGEKALFYIATVKFFREEFQDADHYYDLVRTHYPNGKRAARALKHSIICKQMVTGGPEYDGRELVKARELVQQAGFFPELRGKDEQFLNRQLVSIGHQQAAKDLMIADFYRRTGHPGAAYFYYELVRRRYPGTSYFEKASQRLAALGPRLEREQRRRPQPPPDLSPRPPLLGGSGPPQVLPAVLLNNNNR